MNVYGLIVVAVLTTGVTAQDPIIPVFQIGVNGTLWTRGGIVITDECRAQYEDALRNSAIYMMTKLNNMIGQQLCNGFNDVRLNSAQADVQIEENTSANSEVIFEMPGALIRPLTDIHACGLEVSGYTRDHNNWDGDIIPPIDGCSPIDWNPPNFGDSRREWSC